MNPLRLPAEPASLERIARYVLEHAERAGLSAEAGYRLRLATDELATNVVVHGYRGRAGELRLSAGTDGRSAWVRLEDDAPRFDPSAGCLPPRTELPLSERPIGGLGIHLALTALDGFSHDYAEGHNTSTLVIRLDRPGTPTE
ncbi:ATP-binding protein [Kitasatospora sp. LaBMicrA B282]|uniref:ATP-binding protein n=1 Tax=Kitasatospora sp. LaBMicrA B282 TaxID=3420949 RepID=UPI003D0E7E19